MINPFQYLGQNFRSRERQVTVVIAIERARTRKKMKDFIGIKVSKMRQEEEYYELSWCRYLVQYKKQNHTHHTLHMHKQTSSSNWEDEANAWMDFFFGTGGSRGTTGRAR